MAHINIIGCRIFKVKLIWTIYRQAKQDISNQFCRDKAKLRTCQCQQLESHILGFTHIILRNIRPCERPEPEAQGHIIRVKTVLGFRRKNRNNSYLLPVKYNCNLLCVFRLRMSTEK